MKNDRKEKQKIFCKVSKDLGTEIDEEEDDDIVEEEIIEAINQIKQQDLTELLFFYLYSRFYFKYFFIYNKNLFLNYNTLKFMHFFMYFCIW